MGSLAGQMDLELEEIDLMDVKKNCYHLFDLCVDQGMRARIQRQGQMGALQNEVLEMLREIVLDRWLKCLISEAPTMLRESLAGWLEYLLAYTLDEDFHGDSRGLMLLEKSY